MAEQTGRLRAHEVFWTLDESDADSSLVHVPGVRDPGNRRPIRQAKIKARKTKEIKPVIPASHKPVSQTLKAPLPQKPQTRKSFTKNVEKNVNTKDDENSRTPRASLKELCPEDKQRVANLINELARVGQEKERFAVELNDERTNHEVRMTSLKDQHEGILKEREGVQKQLLDCQRLLARYQHMVSLQQEALSNQDAPPNTENKEQFQATDRQPTNSVDDELWAPRHPATDRPGNRPLSPVSGNSSDQEGGEHTPRGGKKRSLPSAGSGGRPFTAYIDSLIASEQNSSKASHYDRKNPDKVSDSSGTPSERSKPSSSTTGPLHEPVLSSTHQSDSLSISQQSRTKAGEFRILPPDASPRSSLQSPGLPDALHPLDASNPLNALHPGNVQPRYFPHDRSVPVHDNNEFHVSFHSVDTGLSSGQSQAPVGEPRVTFSEQLQQPSPAGLHQPAGYAEQDDFVAQYKAMTSAERQHHLMSQKAALLAEQQRLRHILEEQEHLLHAKQDQLRIQQDLQQCRLDHFEKNGYFPPEPVSIDFHPIYEPMTVPEELLCNQNHVDQITARENMFNQGIQPLVPDFHLPPQRLPNHRIKQAQGDSVKPPFIPPHLNASGRNFPAPNSIDSDSLTKPTWDTEGPVQGIESLRNCPQVSQEEIEAVTDSMENIWFLERRGIEIPVPKRPSMRKGHRSIGSSPLRPGGSISTGQRVQTLEDLINEDSRNSNERPHAPLKSCVQADQRQSYVSYKGKSSEHAASLLDLVDEVESSHPSPGRTRRHQLDQHTTRPDDKLCLGSNEHEVDEQEGEEEEEESRILEEVFFVH